MTLRSSTTPDRPPRSQVVRTFDIVAGVSLALVSGATGLIVMAFLQQLSGLAGPCEGVTPDGARCNPDFLNGALAIGYAGVIFGWFVPIGFMIVRWVRKRLGFFLPLISFVVIIAVFYAVSAALSSYQAVG